VSKSQKIWSVNIDYITRGTNDINVTAACWFNTTQF